MVRDVGGFGSQDELAKKAELDRLQIMNLEKGKGWNSRDVVDGVRRVIGQPYDHFAAYINGEYGPPGRETAEKFLSGAEPPKPTAPPEPMPSIYLEAIGRLALESSRNYAEAAREHLRSFAAHRAQEMDAQTLARQIAELDAERRGKSTGIRDLE